MAELNIRCSECRFAQNWEEVETVVKLAAIELNEAQATVNGEYIGLKGAIAEPVADPAERSRRDQQTAYAEETMIESSADTMSILGQFEIAFAEAQTIDCASQPDFPARCQRLIRIMAAFDHISDEAAVAAQKWYKPEDS